MSDPVEIVIAAGPALGVKDVVAAPGKAAGQELAERIRPRFEAPRQARRKAFTARFGPRRREGPQRGGVHR